MKITSFKRIEKKYIVNEYQKEELIKVLNKYMVLDPYCKNYQTYHIQNIYYDTKQNTLISNSISKPAYKEKLRVRKYSNTDQCFLEIKKKANGIVGKRRILGNLDEINDFINNSILPIRTTYNENQIIKEIAYLLSLYKLEPKTFICYDRLGFFDKEDSDFRITFDSNIRSKRNNFRFDEEDFEFELVEKGKYVLEIKTSKNYPLWLVKELSKLKIYSSSFSKYGTEYIKILKGEIIYGNIEVNN